MSQAIVELLFWIVVFVVFFFGFRKLQKRKEAKAEQNPQKETEARAPGGKGPGNA